VQIYGHLVWGKKELQSERLKELGKLKDKDMTVKGGSYNIAPRTNRNGVAALSTTLGIAADQAFERFVHSLVTGESVYSGP